MARRNTDLAPWPIITGFWALAAFCAWFAAQPGYDTASVFLWISAAADAYFAAHMTAEHIVDRISRRAPAPAPGPAPHPNCRCTHQERTTR